MDWKFFVGVTGTVGAWLWSVYTWRKNQVEERAQKEYQRKEQLYREMLKSIAVFYKGASPSAGAGSFLEQYRLAWLYAPDDVIRSIEKFLLTQRPDVPADQKDQLGQKALAELVATVRRDLFAAHFTKVFGQRRSPAVKTGTDGLFDALPRFDLALPFSAKPHRSAFACREF